MTQPAGFGTPKTPPKKTPTAAAKQRAAAAKEYDELKTSGMPEYTIFLRLAGQPQWMPIGSIAVRRSNQIHAAIYANETELLKGAYHRMPALKKNRANLTFEYGYRLKEFKDDEVAVAVRPVDNIASKFQSLMSNLSGTIGELFKKKPS
jgi:Family of unknown function (DUF6523)